MAYSGLETLFQNLGPTTASQWAGEREGMAQNTDLLAQQTQRDLIRKAQQDYDFSQQENPIKLQRSAADLNNIVAQHGGYVADSRLKGTNADKAAGTLQSDIAASNSTNQTTMLGNKVAAYDNISRLLGQAIPQLEATPPAARHSRLLQLAQGVGLDPKDPQFSGMIDTFSKIDPQKLPQALAQMRNKFVEGSAAYKQTMDVAEMQRKSAEKVAGANNQTQKDVEQMRIDAGKYNKNKLATNVSDALRKSKTDEQSLQIYVQAADEADQNNDPATAQLYTQRAQEAQLRIEQRDANRKAAAAGTIDTPAVANLPAAAGPKGGAPVRGSVSEKPRGTGTAQDPIILK